MQVEKVGFTQTTQTTQTTVIVRVAHCWQHAMHSLQSKRIVCAARRSCGQQEDRVRSKRIVWAAIQHRSQVTTAVLTASKNMVHVAANVINVHSHVAVFTKVGRQHSFKVVVHVAAQIINVHSHVAVHKSWAWGGKCVRT
jgi:hypothetical protein